ncbi:MAG: hypothetical protein HFJ58_04185 [Clostridia bacterium]|nr:hypothetical protein [Clostridia bacterium]
MKSEKKIIVGKPTMSNPNAITLIALIITIIILLILAGVTINLILGDNGLFKTAKQAGESYDEAVAREKLDTVLVSIQADKYTNPKYDEQTDIDNRIIENDMSISGNIVIVDGWQFEIDRSIPKIVASLGKGKESNNINIALTVSYMADFTKGTISITITTNIELSEITINGENVSATNNNGTYNITKDIYDNGNYTIYVKDVNDQYKLKNIKVLGFQKDITILTEEDLLQFAQVVNNGGGYEGKTVTLGKNLDLSTVCYKVDGTTQNDISWTPIGTESNQFKGTFDGNNKIITNIYINSISSAQGLFGSIGSTGVIKDLTVGGSILGYDWCCGISAWNYGKIENCVNNANVTTSHDCAGGITSLNKGIILKCINNGAVIARGEAAGGITAFNANGEDWSRPIKRF